MMDNARPPRPPISRGASTPIYQRRQQQPTLDEDPMRLQGISGLSRIDEVSGRQFNGLATTDSIRRTLGASEVSSSTSSRPMPSPATTAASATQGLFTPPQTPCPPMSSSGRGGATPRVMSPADLPSQTYFPMPSSNQQPYIPMAPTISAASSSSSCNFTPTPLLRQSPQSELKMEIESSRTSHTLLAPLGSKFSADSITIAAKKHNVLQIMADRWDQETDCHFEWLVTLDRDADMSNVTAHFADGLLKVTVKRKVPTIERVANGNAYRVVAQTHY